MSRTLLMAGLLALLLAARAGAEGEGQADLDKATQLKLQVKTLADLEEVIKLADSAITKGLDDGNKKFANQILTASLYQRATKLCEPIFDRQPIDQRWPILRQLAVRDLDRLTELDKENAEAFYLIARLNSLPGGDRAKAEKAIGEAVRLQKDDKEELARDLVLRGDLKQKPEDRLADYEEAIKTHDRCLEAYRSRGLTRLELKKFDEAAGDFHKVLALAPKDLTAMQGLIDTLGSQKKFDDALTVASGIIELLPNDPGGYILRARIYSAKSDNDKALSDLNEALKVQPRDVRALLMRAAVRQAKGDLELARADANRAVEVAPDMPQPILVRAQLSAAAKQFDQAIADVQRLVEADPKNPAWQLQLASLFSADGQTKRAIALVNKLLADEADNSNYLRARGDLYLNVGKQAEAIADYEASLKKDADNVGVLNNLAWVLATSPDDKLRNGARAVELAKKAATTTEEKQGHILSTLAAGYAEQGNFDEATKWSTKAVELGEGEIKEQLKKELESYKQKKPWREVKENKEKPEPPGASPDDLNFGDTKSPPKEETKTEEKKADDKTEEKK